MLLLPVVLLIAFAYRKHRAVKVERGGPACAVREEVPLVPGFLIAFVLLVLLASTGVVPRPVVLAANDVSRWCLVVAISAAGVKTSFQDLQKVGWQPVVMLLTETIVIAAFMLAAIVVFKLGPA